MEEPTVAQELEAMAVDRQDHMAALELEELMGKQISL